MGFRKGLFAGTLAALSGAGIWWYRGRLQSAGLRLLIPHIFSDPARERGLDIRFRLSPPPWFQITLVGELGKTLSEIVGTPVEAVAYSRFGGFPAGRAYSEFQNPDSPYYQVWLGAYAVFDGPGVQRYGFGEDGQPLPQAAVDVLEADQRLVYHGAGCERRFEDGRCVQMRGDFEVEQVEERGQTWWRLTGEADTWSAYHRGVSPNGRWHHPWIYGVVPPNAPHPVDDWHPLVYRGEFWLRYEPALAVSCAKFCIYPEYTDRRGERVTRAQSIVPELRRLLGAIEFAPA